MTEIIFKAFDGQYVDVSRISRIGAIKKDQFQENISYGIYYEGTKDPLEIILKIRVSELPREILEAYRAVKQGVPDYAAKKKHYQECRQEYTDSRTAELEQNRGKLAEAWSAFRMRFLSQNPLPCKTCGGDLRSPVFYCDTCKDWYSPAPTN